MKIDQTDNYLRIKTEGANTYVLDDSIMFASEADQNFITYTRESFYKQLVIMIRHGFLTSDGLADAAVDLGIEKMWEIKNDKIRFN